MNLRTKIKAGALQYVLVVSVVIALIVFAFLSLVYLQQRLQAANLFNKEVIHNTRLGFEYIRPGGISYGEEQVLRFSENPLVKTSITKSHWGIFDIVTITSSIRNQVFKKTALVGANDPDKDALYLREDHQPLVLVGDTRITGNVHISEQGVKRGSIAGISYTGGQLVNGTIYKSSGELPTIQNMEYLTNFYRNFTKDGFEDLYPEEGMELHRPFIETPLLYEHSGVLELSDLSLSGNMILRSDTGIVVHASAKLQDVILMAPRIEVQSNTEGSFQAFAGEHILIGEGCRLLYPTVLAVLDKSENTVEETSSKIVIFRQTDVRGIVLFLSENKKPGHIPHIQIDEEVVLTGEVYCRGNLELKGTVFGSVYTHHFIRHASGGIYLNHILNGIMNRKKLPDQYCGLNLGTNNNKIVKWVE